MTKKLIPILTLALITLSALTFLGYLPLLPSGVTLNFQFKDNDVIGGIWGRDYKVIIQIDAITVEGNITTLYNGFLKQPRYDLDANKNTKFGKIVRGWIKRVENEKYGDYLETSLIINLWFIKKDNTVYRLTPEKVVPYSPKKAIANRLTINVQVDSGKLKKVGGSEINLMSGGNSFSAKYKPSETGIITYYVWELTYSKSTNGYEKIPILMLNNPDDLSAKIRGFMSIDIYKMTAFYGTVSYGLRIFEKASNKQYSLINLMIYRTGNPTYKHKLAYSNIISVKDNQQSYVYMMAKAYYGHYKEVKITMRADGTIIKKEYTGEEKINMQITDVKTDSSGQAYGGSGIGLPNSPSKFMHYFFQGTQMRHMYIEGNYVLSDGELDYGESVPLSMLYDTLDINEDLNFGVGVPVGAFIAALIASTSYAFLAPVIAGLTISLNYIEKSIIYIGGGIKNDGGSIYPEEVWMALSEYVYSYQTSLGIKTFNVPAGTYFYFPTKINSGDGGGCPYLFVYTDEGYVNEGLLDIHSADGKDVTYRHALKHHPIAVGNKYIFKLVEHNNTISHIDYVKLFGVLDNGTIIELPLVRAFHNVFGDVTTWLLFDDDTRIVSVGSYHLPSGSSSSVITLEFLSIGDIKFKSFIFEIQGNNAIVK